MVLYYIFLLHINNLLACIRDFIFMTDVVIIECFSEHDYRLLYYTRVHNVCEYIQSTHWLVPGYCLGQISCMERSVTMIAPEPTQW